MKYKGTQINDKVLMNSALKEFQQKAKKKFKNGIKEHNPEGDKGMFMMPIKSRISCAKEEIIDLWFYLCAIEDGFENIKLGLIKEGLIKPQTIFEEPLYIQGLIERSIKGE